DGWNERLLARAESAGEADLHALVHRVYDWLTEREPSLFAPLLIGWPPERARAAMDTALRAGGWRSDGTARHRRAPLGWAQPSRFTLEAAPGEPVLVLDPDEALDPEGDEAVRRLRGALRPA